MRTEDQEQASKDQPNSQPAVGPYRLVRMIEASGASALWLAEQERPLGGRVALQLIQSHVNPREVMARFQSDRQLMSLDHPAIIKVLEAGSGPQNQLYFAMEYVEGVPISVYCREHHLEIRERMELFVAVCEAIQYAHQRAIIHRDLQPSRILVETVDATPQPKIIGFGIAKALAEAAASVPESSPATPPALETTAYTSPELASGVNIDTRSDVYSLGVILHELLTGDSTTGKAQMPWRSQLKPLLRVALKASAKDRSQRYDSIHELIEDISRCLLDPERAWFERPAVRVAACVLVLILSVIWRVMRVPDSSAKSGLPMARVTVSPSTIMPGQSLEIRIDGVPREWSGELTVNSTRSIPIDSQVLRVKANFQNGFAPGKTAGLWIVLLDSQGRQIPVPNGGWFHVPIIRPAVMLEREGRSLSAEKWSSSFEVAAGAGYKWSVTGVPEWVKINSGETGEGKGVVSYTVLANETNDERSAALAIGDNIYEITQAHPASLQLPFQEKFQYSAPMPESWMLYHRGKLTPNESPTRWTWEQLGGSRGALVSITNVAPAEGNSLLIQRAHADQRPWATICYLPNVNFQLGPEYPFTGWMKAENPVEVGISLNQSTTPWGSCGTQMTFPVSRQWTKFAMSVKVTKENCGPTNNRLTFSVGRVQGKLWIADLSLGGAK